MVQFKRLWIVHAWKHKMCICVRAWCCWCIHLTKHQLSFPLLQTEKVHVRFKVCSCRSIRAFVSGNCLKHGLAWNGSQWIRIYPLNMILNDVVVGPGVWCVPSVEHICKCNDCKLMWSINREGICFRVSHVKAYICKRDNIHTIIRQRIYCDTLLIYGI